jgi:hypothetical protein
MTDEQQDQERAHRDQGRSEEARWQVAEAAAESEEERLSETVRHSRERREAHGDQMNSKETSRR